MSSPFIVLAGLSNYGICGNCKSIMVSPSGGDSHFDKCAYFCCTNCGNYILCLDFKYLDKNCANLITKEEFIEYCEKNSIKDYTNILNEWNEYTDVWKAYPLQLKYIVPNKKDIINSYFEKYDIEDFIKLKFSEKFKIDSQTFTDKIIPDCDDFFSYIGFIGDCINCQKKFKGVVWGD